MMVSAAVLGVCLLAPGAEEIVRSVRVEAPRPERFARYVEVRPGERFSRAAIRHAVELLYATGEFADVVVEAVRGEDGLHIVFRPRPAPLLRQVRIEGDRYLSPRSARRIARLRPREPLWSSRLEEAGRELALALVSKGYLEARVAADAVPAPEAFSGADALFRVHAGPRVRVGSAKLAPAEAPETALIRSLVRPRPGEPYRRRQAERAREAMRKQLVAAGRWRARVELSETYDPGTALMDLVFEVSAGPWTRVEFRGTGLPGSVRSAVEDLLREGGLRPDVLDEGNDRIEEEMRRRGHREVVVRRHEEAQPAFVVIAYEVDAGPQATVASVTILGAAGELDPTALATRPGLPFEERKIDEDVATLTRLLEDRGYVEARVEAEAPKGGGLVPVAFRVRPGPRAVVREVAIDGPVLPPAEEALRELRLRVGAPYRARDVASDREAILAAYRNAGFLKVEVTGETSFTEDRTEARVTLRVTAGLQTRVEHVVVAGLDRTKEVVVRRELLVREGEPLGLQKLLESQRRLGSLGVFGRVSISELDPDRERTSLLVSVAEAPRTTLAYGVGYGERDLARGSVEITQRNLFGMDRTVSAFARGSFRANRFLLSFREPYLLGRRQELFLTAFREEENRQSFDFIRVGGFVQTARTFSPRLSLIVRYAFQDTEVFDIQVPLEEIDREFRTYTAAGPSFSFVNDTRDNPLDPRRGRFVGTDVELSLPAFGGDAFLKGYFQAALYRRLTARTVLAVSARLGLARTFGMGEPLQLPLPERFFAGGAYSLRGFGTDRAGPLVLVGDGERLPTGGNALLLGGAELRMDVTRDFQAAAFTDVGNVYPLVSAMRLDDLRYTAGVGLRYRSSLGPLRVDWGYKLDRRAGERAFRIHFAIGHAF